MMRWIYIQMIDEDEHLCLSVDMWQTQWWNSVTSPDGCFIHPWDLPHWAIGLKTWKNPHHLFSGGKPRKTLHCHKCTCNKKFWRSYCNPWTPSVFSHHQLSTVYCNGRQCVVNERGNIESKSAIPHPFNREINNYVHLCHCHDTW